MWGRALFCIKVATGNECLSCIAGTTWLLWCSAVTVQLFLLDTEQGSSKRKGPRIKDIKTTPNSHMRKMQWLAVVLTSVWCSPVTVFHIHAAMQWKMVFFPVHIAFSNHCGFCTNCYVAKCGLAPVSTSNNCWSADFIQIPIQQSMQNRSNQWFWNLRSSLSFTSIVTPRWCLGV